MKKIYLIGIGPGSPEYLTIHAINAMKKTNVFFLLEKEEECEELIEIRKKIIERYLGKGNYRIVASEIPKRKKGGKAYKDNVETWRLQKAEVMHKLIEQEMKDNEVGAFLIWGEPSLYDGSIEIFQHILEHRTADFEYEIIPGISSIQVLAQRHKIPLNRIGETITITTGRRLKEFTPADIKNVAVVVDPFSAFRYFNDEDLYIYWGAYLGTDDEILVSGKLKDVAKDIEKIKIDARKKKGWIMDTYILRQEEKEEK